jgi:hypothetical protein
MLPQRLNTAIQKHPALSAAARLALRWWLRKSQALLVLSLLFSLVPLFVVPLFAGASLRDALLLFVGAGAGAVVFCCGYISIGYLTYALLHGVVRRHIFVCSQIVTMDILMLSLSPSAVVLFVLYSSERMV